MLDENMIKIAISMLEISAIYTLFIENQLQYIISDHHKKLAYKALIYIMLTWLLNSIYCDLYNVVIANRGSHYNTIFFKFIKT